MNKLFLIVLVVSGIASCADQKDRNLPPGSDAKAAMQQKNEAAPAAKAAKEERPGKREALLGQADSLLTVSVLDMGIVKGGLEPGPSFDQLLIKLGFQNRGPKDIKSVSGEMKFADLSGREIGSFRFQYDDGVDAGRKATWIYTRHDKEFMQSHKALARLEEGKYRTLFQPELIIFTDGSRLTVKE